MKVSELIALLLEQDQDKEVYIQQGGEFEYNLAYSVNEIDLQLDEDCENDYSLLESVVVIQYVLSWTTHSY